ncbi:MAG: phosphomethylpyrimidine synthase ThiC [Candidatus Heimdallarchaeota archaeon]|nr:phosphomethylpyrimidine synthase ThiC [Candidatus Heimdallarchaeota archaeon]
MKQERICIGSNFSKDKKNIDCGKGCPTLIIGSVGTSREDDSLDEEIRKAIIAQELGVDVITDHSFYGDLASYHIELVNKLNVLVSTVGCYEFGAKHQLNGWKGIVGIEAINILEDQANRGIDMITIHASLKAEHIAYLSANNSRIIPTTSKGGGIVNSFMRQRNAENPYYQYFDRILELFKQYNITLSLGTVFRTATVCDKWDNLIQIELETMQGLVERAIRNDVNVMIEGFGHADLASIPTLIKLAKSYCYGVPYRILPMATDVALGFDHISGAIATSQAVLHGANAVTCISRAEHIGLPNRNELEEAVIATRIAAHCAELATLGNYDKDRIISLARWHRGCKSDWKAALFPKHARAALIKKGFHDDKKAECSMCGNFCGISAGKSTKES